VDCNLVYTPILQLKSVKDDRSSFDSHPKRTYYARTGQGV